MGAPSGSGKPAGEGAQRPGFHPPRRWEGHNLVPARDLRAQETLRQKFEPIAKPKRHMGEAAEGCPYRRARCPAFLLGQPRSSLRSHWRPLLPSAWRMRTATRLGTRQRARLRLRPRLMRPRPRLMRLRVRFTPRRVRSTRRRLSSGPTTYVLMSSGLTTCARSSSGLATSGLTTCVRSSSALTTYVLTSSGLTTCALTSALTSGLTTCVLMSPGLTTCGLTSLARATPARMPWPPVAAERF
jgi:hypothetical protein